MNVFWHICIIASVFTATTTALECYHQFLKSVGPCLNGKCAANDNACVFSVDAGQHVCCGPKEGTVQPTCPGGSPSGEMPVLCDPKLDDQCVAGTTCTQSTTDFTRPKEQPNFLCC